MNMLILKCWYIQLCRLYKKAKKILIIGGGDGAVAEEVLKYNYVRKIDLVDIDKEVVDLSKIL